MAKERVYFMYPWEWEDRKQYYIPWFPKSEYDRRVDAVKTKMEKDEIDAVFLYGDVRQYGYIRWLTQFYPQLGQSMVVQTSDGNPILVSSATAHGEPMHSFIPETWVKDVRIGLFHDLPEADHPTLLSRLKEVVDEKNLSKSKVGIVGLNLLTYALYSGLKETYPDIEWVDWGRSYEEIRAVKNDLELDVYRHGAEAIDKAFEAALKVAKPGVNELEVAGILEYTARMNGVDVVSNLFDTRVCSGPRTVLKNANPTERILKKGDSLFIDISMQYKGYCLDVSTSHVVDAEPTKEQYSLFETAALMTEAMIAEAKPGAKAKDMVEITRKIAEENGQGRNFIEYIAGHGMGACQLEIPRFNPDSIDVLEEGMVFALEPMVVDPIHGTGTIERICMVGKKGGELLSKLPLRPWTINW